MLFLRYLPIFLCGFGSEIRAVLRFFAEILRGFEVFA
jgi:hypothetical protein